MKAYLITLALCVTATHVVPSLYFSAKSFFPPALTKKAPLKVNIREWRLGHKWVGDTYSEEVVLLQDGGFEAQSSKRFSSWAMDDKALRLVGKTPEDTVVLKYNGQSFVTYLHHPDRKLPYFLKATVTH